MRYTSNFIIMIGLALTTGRASGQQSTPNPYGAAPVNYVRTWQAKAPIGNPDSIIAAGLREVKQTTVYVDGLGRNLQTVVKKGSLPYNDTARDLVKGQVYDAQGRHSIDYLLFAANNTGGNTSVSNGGFKRNPFAQEVSCYNQRLAGQPGETNVGGGSLNWAYNQTLYDGSPLDRTTQSLPAGMSWVGSGRGIRSNYWVNTVADSVRAWQVTDVANDWGTYNSTGMYAAGMLYKNLTTDEQGKQTIEFKDKAGRLVLRKMQTTATADAGTGSGHQGWACTYYVYDDLDNLRLVVQPVGVELLAANSWNTAALSGAILAEQCYRYEYNYRKMMIRKKDPGVGEVWLVYDGRDRLVLVQDANLRSGSPAKWLYTLYDELNRPVSTGLWNNNQLMTYHKAAAENSSSYPNLTGATYEELTVTHYDDYAGLPAGFAATMSSSNINSNTINTNYNTSPEYAEPLTQTVNPSGMITWTKVKVLGTGQYLYAVNYYDDKARLIQEQVSNVSGAISTTSRQYNFAGQVIRTVQLHNKDYPNSILTNVYSKHSYDDLGRIISIGQKINISSGPYKTIAEYGYDELGQLKVKKMGTHPVTGQALETQDYVYNVRGWLVGANRGFATDTSNQSRYFGYDIGYDNEGPAIYGAAHTFATKRYDGGIGRVLWKSAGDQKIRKYEASYDNLNQLTGAAFYQYKGSGFTQSELDFSVSGISYDANGNLQKMLQKGWKPGGTVLLDSLLYTYYPHSNRLRSVLDGVNDTATQLGDFRSSTSYMAALGGTKTTTATDYLYDANGNMSKDLNKDLGFIRYNHLNLPAYIALPGKGTISYLYDARGTKLQKTVVDSTVSPVLTSTTYYVDNFVYESREHAVAQPDDEVQTQQFFTHAEGRTRFKGIDGYKYDYFVTDHLNNVRMVLSEELTTDPYPTLTLEGAVGSPAITAQNTYWENKTGASINVAAVRSSRPGAFGDTSTNGQQVMLVRKSTGAIGAAKLLKVMKGDRCHIYLEYFYTAANTNNTGASGITSLLTSFASALSASPGVTDLLKPGAATLSTALGGNAALSGLLNSAPNTSGSNQAPKAYLNVLFFDEQLRFDQAASRVYPVAYTPNTKGVFDKRLANAIEVGRNGYVYIYFSNESDELVYFDNFMLTHEHSPLLEENHYYPFGLSIAALSSKSIGKTPNRYGYNGKEKQSRELGRKGGLEWYDYGSRMYDPQTGRWPSPDPSASSYNWLSPYNYGFNNPLQVIDPTGRDGIVTGSGSQSDPYVVKANYYYYGMNDDQKKSFMAAIREYNNDGKARAIKTKEGTVYVKFDLGAKEATDKADAKKRAGEDVEKDGEQQYSFGNTVTVGNVRSKDGTADENTYGGADNQDIVLDDDDLVNLNQNAPGASLEDIRRGNVIHEIGHNLGGVHGDPGNIMSNLNATQIIDPNSISSASRFRYTLQAVDNDGTRAIIGRMDTPRGGVESKYLTPKEDKAIKERDGRAGIIWKIPSTK
ncbi:RHS repeat-associated core domain-containing protein [Paraflavitalea soli]|uniref:RHS repeat-associated core domain-containing protein n=1 Tax=Paraflavitalea soli TaxID=2315862 RepID=A0A3B7MSU4_9BACT|nr:DUF6443 domain-containing protein [Paraflavitalea soli]AXY77624.1 RHS repeat-associated core domain-containing protein [Paraflavitalea soli]